MLLCFCTQHHTLAAASASFSLRHWPREKCGVKPMMPRSGSALRSVQLGNARTSVACSCFSSADVTKFFRHNLGCWGTYRQRYAG